MADQTRCIDLDPEGSARAYFDRGVLKQELGHHEAAIDDYSRSIEIFPDRIDAWNNRGVARAVIGREPEALADLKRALALAQGDERACRNLKTIVEHLQQKGRPVSDETLGLVTRMRERALRGAFRLRSAGAAPNHLPSLLHVTAAVVLGILAALLLARLVLDR